MLPKYLRISNKSDFYRIKKYGGSINSPFFSLKYLKSTSPELAVIVSKKINNKASIRNRIKRKTKSLIITNSNLPSYKILIFPKPGILQIPHSLLIKEFQKLLDNLL
jgi:ribonuclease P protein component